ncbi:MAG TPA: hypothetical protein VE569_02065 [Acidimicrobiia bacterium]|nr:hypothetical protein [Acidimicrobiia bacterium]
MQPPGDDDLDKLADSLGLDDPPQDAEFERYISPWEYAAVMVPCLTEQGIPVRADGANGILFGDVPVAQARAQAEALYRCKVRFPTDPLFNEPVNEEQLRFLYEYQVGDLTACLESEGYSVPPAPSLESFIESYTHPGGDVWSPYPTEDPRLEQPAEWHRLNKVCPQNPPLDVLYGVPDSTG